MLRKRSAVLQLAVILFIALWLVWQPDSFKPGGPEMSKPALAVHVISIHSPIAKGLDNFRFDVGRYPTTAEGLAALFWAPPGVDGWRGPYLPDAIGELTDPWGRAFLYRCPAEFGKDGYDLWSRGPDGRDDGGAEGSDDVANWR